MEDVTGFNQKSNEFDGEKLVANGLQILKQRYNDNNSFADLLKLMLKFNEHERPSFVELQKLLASKNNVHEAAFTQQHS
jgi:hypothetical protein